MTTLQPQHQPQEESARRLVLLAALAKQVEAAITVEKQRYARLAPAGNTQHVDRDGPGMGPRLGRVTRPTGSVRAQVTDGAALLRWMRAHYPDNTAMVPFPDPPWQIRAAALAGLLLQCEEAGVPVGPGGEVGEDAPPGITVYESAVRGVGVTVVPDNRIVAENWPYIRAQVAQLINDAAGAPAQIESAQ